MGSFVNPNNSRFVKDLNSPIYVDKSEMVLALESYYDTGEQYICMSRARRFGKTMMTNLLAAYYSKGCDSRALFQNLKLAQHEGWDKHLNSVNVIKVDINGRLSKLTDKTKVVQVIQEEVVAELRQEFPSVEMKDGIALSDAIMAVNNALGETFVIIFDEYDVIFRSELDKSVRTEYLDFLNSLFKDDALKEAISLAYLTGILPIIKEQVQSKLNNFEQFTMLEPKAFAPFFGFTEEEVKQLCQKYGMDYERCASMYDGYVFPGVGHIFNPNSLVKSMKNKDYDRYWNATSSFEAITTYLDENISGIQDDIRTMLDGGTVTINTSLYENNVEKFSSKDQIFTYLIHLGYLTLNSETDRRNCRIPNGEIRQEWFNALISAKRFKDVNQILEPSRAVVDATLNMDAKKVAKALDVFHAQCCSSLTYNQESSMQSAIMQAYLYAQSCYMHPIAEFPAGLGFADVALIPLTDDLPAIIIELKKSGSPQVAIDQIKARNYASAFAQHPGKGVIIVGISYDPDERRHKCLIENVEDYETVWK